MNGQLWQECERGGCESEPVCMDCFYCDRHCGCADQKRDREIEREIERRSPGLLRRVGEHLEQGEIELD